jgi:SAM-dependent methyltransferase
VRRNLPVADVGAGTGISARLLGDRGVHVLALEPNAAMREAAAPHPCVTWREATAEATGLDEGAVGLVLCAQSFHWFDPARALPEFHRVLAKGCRLAVLTNDHDDTDPFTRGYSEAIEATAEDLAVVHRPEPAGPIGKSPLFTGLRIEVFANSQEHDLAGLEARALSASYVPREPARLQDLLGRLRALHARFADAAGKVVMRYETRVRLADRVD